MSGVLRSDNAETNHSNNATAEKHGPINIKAKKRGDNEMEYSGCGFSLTILDAWMRQSKQEQEGRGVKIKTTMVIHILRVPFFF